MKAAMLTLLLDKVEIPPTEQPVISIRDFNSPNQIVNLLESIITKILDHQLNSMRGAAPFYLRAFETNKNSIQTQIKSLYGLFCTYPEAWFSTDYRMMVDCITGGNNVWSVQSYFIILNDESLSNYSPLMLHKLMVHLTNDCVNNLENISNDSFLLECAAQIMFALHMIGSIQEIVYAPADPNMWDHLGPVRICFNLTKPLPSTPLKNICDICLGAVGIERRQ